MRVVVNGTEREVPEDATVEDLIRDLGLRPDVVAVEINGEVVPRDGFGERRLAPGDRVELVTLVGGG